MNEEFKDREEIQKLIARLIARNPAGYRLVLIGGFRYRLLSQSARTSLDIDYHWDGDLERKQEEVAKLLRDKAVPESRRRFGYEGIVRTGLNPAEESKFVKVIEAAFHHPEKGAFAIPIELTTIPILDPPTVRTLDGAVFLTASDADMVESKVIALFGRTATEARDLLDLFLFQDHTAPDAPERIREKIGRMHWPKGFAEECLDRIRRNRAVLAKSLDALIRGQVEPDTAAHLEAAGGGEAVFDSVLALLANRFGLGKRPS